MKPVTQLHQVALLGLGEHRASRIVDNHEVSAELDTDDAWIRQRTGIVTRRLADDTETVEMMAAEAGRKAVAESGIDPAAIGLVLVASCSMAQTVPGAAATVATALGAHGAGAMDVGAACAGFVYGLSIAADAVRTGTTEYVVVVGSERLSDITDWSDRSSAMLFGDGAGAVVVGRSQTPGVGPVVMGSDGERAGLITMTTANNLTMDGPAVFRWATTALGDVARHACAAAGVAPEDLTALVPHQANLRIVTAVARQLGAEGVVVADDIVDAGNTSAASIPLALSRLRDEGKVGTGDLALLLGFGGGLTWAGCVVTVP